MSKDSFLKGFVLFCLAGNTLFACSGDCIRCHPALIKNGHLDDEHKILSTCLTCHKTDTNDLARMGAACGQDCWECHDVRKVMSIPNKEHFALQGCIDCHKKLDKSDLRNFFNK